MQCLPGFASTASHHSSLLNSMWSLSVYTHALHDQAYIYLFPLRPFALNVKKTTFQTAIASTPVQEWSHSHMTLLVNAWRSWHWHRKGVFHSLSQKVAGGTEGCHLHESASESCAWQRGLEADTCDGLLYDVFDTRRVLLCHDTSRHFILFFYVNYLFIIITTTVSTKRVLDLEFLLVF